MRVPFIDLAREPDEVTLAMRNAIEEVLTSRHFIGGPSLTAFEDRFARRIGTSHAVGVSSGTDAILASLMALDIGPGDEVLVPDFTFVSPASCVARLGATPVFVDIDPVTYAIDAARARDHITPATRAIIAVHLFGQMADMPAILHLAREFDLHVVEDAAQAIGATQNGAHAGTIGSVGTFSFFPTKNLGAAGDAGMVVTNDDALAEKLRRIRNHGSNPKYHHNLLGGNFRLDAIQAAILNARLDFLDDWTEKRRRHAAYYDAHLPDWVERPSTATMNGPHTFHQYTLRVSRRDYVREKLSEWGIETMVYYPEPLSTQPIFGHLKARTHAQNAADTALCLPVHPYLSDDERARVVEAFVRLS